MKIGNHCKAENSMAKYGEMRIFILKVELKNKDVGY